MSEDERSSDDQNGSLLYERTFDNETTATIAIIESLAMIENVDPTDIDEELEPPFHRCFDIEALNDLVSNVGERGELFLELFFDTYRIWISDGGRIRIWNEEE